LPCPFPRQTMVSGVPHPQLFPKSPVTLLFFFEWRRFSWARAGNPVSPSFFLPFPPPRFVEIYILRFSLFLVRSCSPVSLFLSCTFPPLFPFFNPVFLRSLPPPVHTGPNACAACQTQRAKTFPSPPTFFFLSISASPVFCLSRPSLKFLSLIFPVFF